MTLSILTLNLWNDAGPWPERADLIRDWIERLDPDVIAFQEALRGPEWDQVADLVGPRGYHHAFGKASPFWRDPARSSGNRGADAFGNAIASRWPLQDPEVIALANSGDGETRAALSVTVDSPHGPLSVTSTHLHWKYRHGAVRERQVMEVTDLVLRRRPRDGFPPLLLGDFNAEPESAEVRYVQGLQSLEGRSVAFLDAWRVAGDGGAGYTWNNANPYAQLYIEPNRRIDYVFAGFPMRDGRGRIEHCRVVCNEPSDSVWPSDHFGVYAELASVPIERTSP